MLANGTTLRLYCHCRFEAMEGNTTSCRKPQENTVVFFIDDLNLQKPTIIIFIFVYRP